MKKQKRTRKDVSANLLVISLTFAQIQILQKIKKDEPIKRQIILLNDSTFF